MSFGHFLQSSAWEKYEQLERHKTFRVKGEGFNALAVLKTTPLGNYLFCPYGPAAKDKAGLEGALSALRELAKEQKAFFVRVEPTLRLTENSADVVDKTDISVDDLRKLKLVKSHDLEPAHTWVIDLTCTREELLGNIEKRKVRYWRTHENKNMKIRITKDPEEITILTGMLQALGERDNFTPQDEQHLKNQLKAGFATLYVMELDGKPIAATLVHDYGDTRFTMHAAAEADHMKLVPGTILQIQEMLDAQDAGMKKIDFWGMTPSNDPKHPWYGFTQYKKSFGGYQVNYCGTWDLPVNGLKYKMYQVVRKLNRLKRKKRH